MKHSTVWLLILVLLAGGGGYFIWQQDKRQNAPVPAESQPLVLPEKPPEPEIKYPVPEPPVQIDTQITPPEEVEEEVEKPLPSLEQSDDAIQEEFARLFDQGVFGKLFIFKAFIQRFVVIIDNLTAPKLPQKYRLTVRPPKSFIVNKNAQGKLFIDPRNYQRYSTYVDFVEAIDTQALTAAYVHFYPLIQQAYEAMGYPDQYFNDRLVEVIDHLLATPDVLVPIELIRPNVFYKFADPKLESLSAGQKILLRIGYDNAFRVKSKLKELREAITSLEIGF
jgi:hypothetical protein